LKLTGSFQSIGMLPAGVVVTQKDPYPLFFQKTFDRFIVGVEKLFFFRCERPFFKLFDPGGIVGLQLRSILLSLGSLAPEEDAPGL
jgi:hypothetical protein